MLALAVEHVLTLKVLLSMFVGVVAGITAGAIPGFTITMAIILTLPFTYGMTPVQGMAAMVGVYVGGLSGGLITAALLGIPGTPSAIATTFDGFPMARKGEPGRALGIGVWASFFGTVISTFVLVLVTEQIAQFAIKLGPWEYFSLIIFSLTIIASISGESLIKGLLAGFFGLFIATIGMDPISGITRFTFGTNMLSSGIPFLVVLIGIFAMSQMLTECEGNKLEEEQVKVPKEGLKFYPLRTCMEVLRQPVNLIRSSIIGTIIGAIPGAGGSISNILAYDQAKKASKYPQKFGTGIPDGIVASESGNSSTAGGSLITTIALGIPGTAVTAVMLGALMIHGIRPGPMLIQTNPEVVYGIYLSFVITSFMMLVVQFLGIRLFTRIVEIPKFVLIPSVISFCVVGSYVLNNRYTDLYILLIIGVIGYILKKYKYPLTAVILGVILGSIAETNLRRAYMISRDWTLFFVRPISLSFILLAALSVIYSIHQAKKLKKKMKS